MGRTVKPFMIKPEWPQTPSAATVAPHRYTWTDSDLADLDSFDISRPGMWRAMMAAVAYQPGDVVMIVRDGVPTKALITDVWVRRSDHTGERREIYRVIFANKKGDAWSKLWEKTHPGFIQRGYLAAGLAPDCEGKL